MAKIAGIIAEYDPFHLGHRYQIQETRRQTGAGYIVVVMSGNFVQRGEPAIFEKSQRAWMALQGGADLVLELPAPFAVGSAEDFASGGISLLHQLGAVDLVSFGSECGTLAPLRGAARALAEESAPFQDALKAQLRRGLPYPQARAAALKSSGVAEEILQVLDTPNNLLGIEYIKALLRQKSSMEPFTVKRDGLGYHDDRLLPEGGAAPFASASALRRAIFALCRTAPAAPLLLSPGQDRAGTAPSDQPGHLEQALPDQPDHPEQALPDQPDQPEQALPDRTGKQKQALSAQAGRSALLASQILEQIPPDLHPLYTSGSLLPIHPDDCSSIFNYRILSCIQEKVPLEDFSDISPELAGRIRELCDRPRSFSEQIMGVKTKQYTYTRVNRSLLHLLLHIRKEDMMLYRRSGYCSYARILGFKRSAAPLLRTIKEKSAIPLIAKAADAPKLLSPSARRLWDQDIYCSHVYHGLVQQRYKVTLADEYRRPVLVL